MNKKSDTQTVLVIAAYIAAQILADIGCLKIFTFAGFNSGGGIFIYPLTFTLRDMIHKHLGRKAARTTIIAAGVLNAIMAVYLYFLSSLTPADSWLLQDAFAALFSSLGRIVIASIIAEVVGELLDTEIYHLWVTKVTKKYHWTRVLVSNSISIPLDSLIFCWGAFGGVLPAAIVWSIVKTQLIMKGITTLIGLPAIYLVSGKTE